MTDRKIAGLNRRYRARKKATDVLSFPMMNELLGDIFVSLDTAHRQAIADGVAIRVRCLVLIIHGLLHLVGYDHHTKKEWEIMHEREKSIQKMFGIKTSYNS